jgi:hypothetical protein
VEVEVHQSGGALGLDRRYLVKGRKIEVIDNGHSRGKTTLDAAQAARIHELATSAAAANVKALGLVPPDEMETKIAVRNDKQRRVLTVRTGDEAPSAIWDLIGEVSRATDL